MSSEDTGVRWFQTGVFLALYVSGIRQGYVERSGEWWTTVGDGHGVAPDIEAAKAALLEAVTAQATRIAEALGVAGTMQEARSIWDVPMEPLSNNESKVP